MIPPNDGLIKLMDLNFCIYEKSEELCLAWEMAFYFIEELIQEIICAPGTLNTPLKAVFRKPFKMQLVLAEFDKQFKLHVIAIVLIRIAFDDKSGIINLNGR